MRRGMKLRNMRWEMRIKVQRYLLGPIGRDMVSYRGPDARWIFSYRKDDEEARRIGQQLLRDTYAVVRGQLCGAGIKKKRELRRT